MTGPSCVCKWSLLISWDFFVKKKTPKNKKLIFTLKWNRLLQPEFYEKQFLCPCIFFLNNKVAYKKECEQFVIWPVVLLAPRGRGLVLSLGKNHAGKPVGAVCCQWCFLCVPLTTSMSGGEHSLFNFKIVLGIVAVY